jgi:hypothetical protein
MTWDATNIVGTAIAVLLGVAVLCMFAAQSVVELRRFALRFLWTSVALLALHAVLIIAAKVGTGDGNYMRVFWP